jgi:hypothetical protein
MDTLNLTQTKKVDDHSLISNYEFVLENNNSNEFSVIVKPEWVFQGDYFKKLSIYNENFQPISGLGNTTLIK